MASTRPPLAPQPALDDHFYGDQRLTTVLLPHHLETILKVELLHSRAIGDGRVSLWHDQDARQEREGQDPGRTIDS